jgi:hypothetical protein
VLLRASLHAALAARDALALPREQFLGASERGFRVTSRLHITNWAANISETSVSGLGVAGASC